MRRESVQAEALERRTLMAIAIVTNINDLINGNTSTIAALNATPGADGISLREAITAANNNVNAGGADEIRFGILGNGPFSIAPSSELPAIADAVLIDATTQSGYTGTPRIQLNGTAATAALAGLRINANGAGSTIRGLAVNQWGSIGIAILGNNNAVEACFIGLDTTGTQVRANGYGVYVGNFGPGNLTGNRIGGTTAAQRNLISANSSGILLEAASNGTLIQGNYIGTDVTGTLARGNTVLGIEIIGAPSTAIGGVAGARNVISGNLGNGVSVTGATAAGTLIAGNYIGTDTSGTLDLGNGNRGVVITDSPNNTIGGATAAARNVISGNSGQGVYISGAASTGNVISGNYIGTNAAGSAALANSHVGIDLDSVSLVTVGGVGAGNVISANAFSGVRATNCTSLVIAGNFIGTDAAGNSAIGNNAPGIELNNTTFTAIGGTAPGAGNVLSANSYGMVALGGGNQTIEGNFIGTNAAGTAALGNFNDGILISGNGHRIGGTTVAARNIISANVRSGIRVSGGNPLIQGNYIGSNAAGTIALGNGFSGIRIDTASQGTTIGGSAPGAGNVISANNVLGLMVEGSQATIQGNYIGTNAAGTAVLGSQSIGIDLFKPATIGGAAAGAGNVISGNDNWGINSEQGAVVGAVSIQGNYIGTNALGTATIGNATVGINLNSGDVTVGGTAAGAANVISGNVDGIFTQTPGNTVIEGNFIGTNAAGTAALGNTRHGIRWNTLHGRIGGTTPAARNIISGNGGDGISMSRGDGVLIQGNYIGTNVSGLAPVASLGNGGNGILIAGIIVSNVQVDTPFNNVIGGINPAARNVITNNAGNGIMLVDADANVVQGNTIGPDITRIAGPGNGLAGVQIRNNSQNNTIGGATAAAGNVIAFNHSDGVWVYIDDQIIFSAPLWPDRNSIRHNSIFANAGLGIDLEVQTNIILIDQFGNSGEDHFANDFQDVDFGPNSFQNFPVLASVTSIGGSTTIQGTLNSVPNRTFIIDFYVNDALDPSGFGEGKTYLGSLGVAADAGGNVVFNATFAATLNSGQFISATATRTDTAPYGDTSEFSQSLQVVTPGDTAPPVVLESSFSFLGTLPTPYVVDFQLSEAIVSSGGGVPLPVRRIDNGQLVATVMANIEGGTVVTGQMSTPLANGNYRATLPAGVVVDLSGNPLGSDVDVNFFILGGDANRSGTVNISDLSALASNWQGNNKTFAQADFNYDGTVNLADLVILSANWQKNNITFAAPVNAPAMPSLSSLQPPARAVVRKAVRPIDVLA